MSLFNKLFQFFKNLLKKDKVKMIEATNQYMSQSNFNTKNVNVAQTQVGNENYSNTSAISENKKNEFIDSLKANVKDIDSEEKCIIETPICVGDGLGIQTNVSA